MNNLLFDRPLLRIRARRVAPRFAEHDFLFREMATEIAERLSDIRRRFDRALLLDRHGILAEALKADASIASCTCDEALDEEALPFENAAFDAVLSLGRLHWVNDFSGALSEMRRVLKPDGLLLAAFPGGETLHELRDAILKASLEEECGASPRVSPFVDARDAGALLQRAGFALPVIESRRIVVRYKDALSLMRDLRGMGEANALCERARRPLRRRTLHATQDTYSRLYRGEDGRIPATFEIILLTAWKPHASQPQPLKRGSGKINLGKALED